MNQLRQPPIFTIAGTGFLVDVDKQVLRQTDDPANEISFIDSMQDHHDHYLLIYDISLKNCPGDHIDPNDIRSVIVPQLTSLDPEGMAEKYGLTISQLSGKTDFDVLNDQETLALRHQGVLPQITIDGENFIIDLNLHELRHAENFSPVISLSSFHVAADEQHYEAYFDRAFKQPVPLDEKLTEFPQQVVQLKIPNAVRLDPVGFARRYGWEERMVLRRYPIQKALKAEIIPLSETNIPAMIQRNREALRQQHRENMRQAKPRFRPKF
jgi:hypothetical protein